MKTFAILFHSDRERDASVIDAFQCWECGDSTFRLAVLLTLRRLTMEEQERGFYWPIEMKAKKIGNYHYRIFFDEDSLVVPYRQGTMYVMEYEKLTRTQMRKVFNDFIRSVEI